ncbi:MAG TPA: hypothetical protein VK907_11245 [Phnomibacter sp.]|nr:hypothetical protein [Phnomibacter sp.]
MKPFSSRFTVPLYFVAAIFTIWGISLNFVEEIDPGDFGFVMPLVYLSTVIFIVLSVREVLGSPKISSNEKIMWTVGLILLSLIAGLVYSLMGRERVVEAY